MPILLVLAVAATLVTRSAFGAGPCCPLGPPAPPRAEPLALPRSAVEERSPLELLSLGRVFAPLPAPKGGPGVRRTGLGAGVGVGFRNSPYFSLGAEGSALRASTGTGGVATTLEGAAVGRVYLLEAGALDPYLELALGYGTEQSAEAARGLVHGPSARAGAGLDVVVASPIRLGALLAYREVVEWSARTCAVGCGPRRYGGVLAGVAVTLPLGEPL